MDEAARLKERGNVAFKQKNYAQAEHHYTEALGCYSQDHLIFNNRANARLKLQRWEDARQDCFQSIRLKSQNYKAYYFKAQAELGLDRHEDALSSALKAYEQLQTPTNAHLAARDLPLFSAFVLKCKKARFSKRDSDRRRRQGDLQIELEELLETRRRQDLDKVTQRLEAMELRPEKGVELRQDIESTHSQKLSELHSVFLLGPSSAQPREIPEHLIDVITFEIMHDPVVTRSGQSYERSTILEHLRRSQTDPLTRELLKPDDLRPNIALKAACDEFWDSDRQHWVIDW